MRIVAGDTMIEKCAKPVTIPQTADVSKRYYQRQSASFRNLIRFIQSFLLHRLPSHRLGLRLVCLKSNRARHLIEKCVVRG